LPETPRSFVVARDPPSPPEGLDGAVAALGNFDGLHRGHRGVIARALKLARAARKPCAVVTFEPHPADFFAGRPVIFRLTPPEAKAALLARLGLDGMIILTFDAGFAALAAQEFTSEILGRRLGVSAVVAGYDFRFGAGRRGDTEFLRAEGKKLGFGVEIVECIAYDEAGSLDAVSSTATREALERGDMALARLLLGDPYFVEGVVIHGDKRGRGLGFPTANIALDPSNRLRHGVYAVTLAARGVVHRGVASFGRRPTFDDGAPLLEVHVFDFSGDLYGEMVEVVFYEFLRGEAKFESIDALIVQMHEDAARAKEILAREAAG
jgi:riboflavin kinase / FMN adenylyltransferase